MSIVDKFFGRHGHFVSAVTRPGGWVAQDPNSGRHTANLMLRLHTSLLEPAVFKHLPSFAGPQVEVRVGVLARHTLPGILDAWVSAHQNPDLRSVAQDHAEHFARQGLREVRQYLWLAATLPDRLSTQAAEKALAELENLGKEYAAQLRVSYSAEEDWREVAETYEPTKEPADRLPRSTALSFFPEQPDWTGYLQGDQGALVEARRVVPVLLQQPQSFTVWVTGQCLSVEACRRAARDLAVKVRALRAPGTAAYLQQRLAAAFSHNLVRCQYQLTLHRCPEQQRQQAQALLRPQGLDFRESSPGLWGWRATPKAFQADEATLMACCPLQPVVERPLTSGGLLLRAEASTPLVFDPFDSAGSHNVMVTGGPGTGKDYLCRGLLSAHVAQGQPAWVIGGDCSAMSMARLVDVLGGRTEVVAAGSRGLNPLAMCQNEEDVRQLGHWLAALLQPHCGEGVLASGWRLEEALAGAWKNRSAALALEQVRRELELQDNPGSDALAQGLAPYTRGGPWASLFSGDPLDLNTESLLVLDTTAFWGEEERAISMTLLAMLSLHWQQQRSSKRKLAYVGSVDLWERDRYAKSSVAEFLEKVLRRARMLNGALMTGFHYQDWDGANRSPLLRTVLANSGWHALLKFPSDRIDLLEQTKSPEYPDKVFALWKQARTRHGVGGEARFVLCSADREATLVTLTPGPLHHALHSTNVRMVNFYHDARQQGLAPLDALKASGTTEQR